MKYRFYFSALAIISAAVFSSSIFALATAEESHSGNDLLLFLMNPAGTTGTDQVVYYNLGSTSDVFREAATPGTDSIKSPLSLGNINAILTSTYGADWTSRSSTIFAGAVGQNGNTGEGQTDINNGDYAQTIYVTKPRSSLGTAGQPNSSSPLYDPEQTNIAEFIASSNNITEMSQPGAVNFSNTLIDDYNPFFNGTPALAYTAISGGIQGAIGASTSFESISAIVLLDLYRVTKTTGLNSNAPSLWHIANNVPATYINFFQPGDVGARADFLGTIAISANGDVSFAATDTLDESPVNSGVITANGTVGVPFSYSIVVGDSATSFGASLSQAEGAATANLSINTSTGLISGTPVNEGIAAVPVSATTFVGTVSSSLILSISAPPVIAPQISNVTLQNGQVGTAFTYQITASNNATSYGALGLPTGLSANATTGLISGTPTSAGNYTSKIMAANSGGNSFANLPIRILPLPPAISSNSSTNGQVGTAFSFQITANNSATSYAATGLPTGLSANSTSGLISGNPTVAGNFTANLTARNAGGNGTAALAIRILPARPTITGNAITSGQVGTVFNFQITASNNATSYAASGLPVGLSIDSATGRITGTPTTAGNYSANLTAANSGGNGTAALAIRILPARPTITSNTTANGQVGTAFNFQITASNNATSYETKGLPADLNVNSSTGLISGTPITAGNFTAILTARNAGGNGTGNLTIRILPARPAITSSGNASGQVGTAFNFQITTSNNATSFQASSLPAGLSINATRGLISGTPTTAGNFTANLTAANSGGNASAVLRIQILPARPAITSNSSASGQVGTAFSFQITASNNATSYQAIGLPTGLNLTSATGLISGTPTAAGNFSINLMALNAGGNGLGNMSIRILPARPAITSSGNASGQIGTAFSFQITANNSATSYAATGLPTGLSANSTSGLISGTPTAVGNFTANLTARNAGGNGTANLTIRILPARPAITSNTSVTGQVGTAFSYQITASNNATAFGATGLPTGLSANSTTGLISGSPTAVGNFTANLTARNAGGNGTAALSIRILPPRPSITSNASANGQVGSVFSYQISATNNATSYSATGLPGGLSLDNTRGLISGTPASAGNFSANLTARNAGGNGTASLAFRILPARPAITSNAAISGQVGMGFVYQITASNNATSYGATGLPGGLNLDTSRGRISGTPTTAGNFTVSLMAMNAGGNGTASLPIRILPGRPTITSSGNASGQVGTAFSFQITVSNNATSYQALGLPTGLSVSSNTGLITGTPAASGNFAVSLMASNAGGNEFASLTIRILPARPSISSNSSTSGRAGTAFSFQITASNNATSYQAMGLPTGLSVNSTSGLISGTPSASGNFAVSLMASNAGGNGLANLSIRILPALPVMTSNASANGQVGSAFSYQIIASNNPTSYAATNLPTGLSLGPTTGLISGAPTTAGNFTANLTFRNAGGNGTAALAIRILPVRPAITSNTTASGRLGTPFSYQILATNTPASYAATGVPNGLSLDTTTGLLSGSPATAGNFTTNLTARNAGGNGTATLRIAIAP